MIGRLLLLATWGTVIWGCWLALAKIAASIRDDDRRNVRMVYDPKTDTIRLALVYDYTVWNPAVAAVWYDPFPAADLGPTQKS